MVSLVQLLLIAVWLAQYARPRLVRVRNKPFFLRTCTLVYLVRTDRQPCPFIYVKRYLVSHELAWYKEF